MAPTGASAHVVSYRCTSGREALIVVDVPDLGRLADQINRIQPCEYDRGLSHATVTVTCHSSSLVVQLKGRTDGKVAQPTSEALCL